MGIPVICLRMLLPNLKQWFSSKYFTAFSEEILVKFGIGSAYFDLHNWALYISTIMNSLSPRAPATLKERSMCLFRILISFSRGILVSRVDIKLIV